MPLGRRKWSFLHNRSGFQVNKHSVLLYRSQVLGPSNIDYSDHHYGLQCLGLRSFQAQLPGNLLIGLNLGIVCIQNTISAVRQKS